LEGAEAREEDAEGMLRPKPKEQPMSKLCEAWATAARLEETCERSGGGRECARAIEHGRVKGRRAGRVVGGVFAGRKKTERTDGVDAKCKRA